LSRLQAERASVEFTGCLFYYSLIPHLCSSLFFAVVRFCD